MQRTALCATAVAERYPACSHSGIRQPASIAVCATSPQARSARPDDVERHRARPLEATIGFQSYTDAIGTPTWCGLTPMEPTA
jgi:hypothetical protein